MFWRDLVSAFPTSKKLDGAIVVCYPRAPFFAINHAANVKVDDGSTQKLMSAFEEHFRSSGLPYVCIRISPLTNPNFASILESDGFAVKSKQSIMVFKGKEVAENAIIDFSVKEVGAGSEVQVFTKLMIKIFEMPPEQEEGFAEFNQESARVGWRFYLAHIGEEPVGTCALFSSGKVGGIFNVGTLASFRKKGIGTALTLRALSDSMRWGNEIHTLQAEHGGSAEVLYKKLGFETDHTVRFFAKDFR